MSSTDYFGDGASETAPREVRRHRSRSTRHRKHHHRRSDYDSDTNSSPVEEVIEEKQYYDPVTGTATRELTKTEYVEGGSRRHRHRHRDPVTSDDEDTATAATTSTRSSGRRHRSSRAARDAAVVEAYEAPPQPAYPGSASTASYDRESGYTSRSPSPERRRERRKSVGETALATLGLGAIAEKMRQKKDDIIDDTTRSQSRRRSSRRSSRRHDPSDSEDYSSEEDRDPNARKKNAGQAAILAAAVEAFRARHEPGGITGPAALKRIVEAAIASGALEGFLGRKGDRDGKSTRHIIEAVIGGLGAQHAVNGRRARSQSGSHTLRDLAGSALIAGAGKKLLDKVDDKQRARSASRPRDDSRSSRRERPSYARQRSHSAGDILAAVGLGGAAEAAKREYDKRHNGGDRDRRSDRRSRDVGVVGVDDDQDDTASQPSNRTSRRSRRSVDDYATSNRGAPNDGAVIAAYPPAVATDPNGQVVTAAPSSRGDDRSLGRRNKKKDSSSSSDLSDMDSDDERKKTKELRRNEFLGIALAVIGSLHAAATIYEGKEKREKRIEELKSGKITPAEAKKKKSKAQFRDVASVGLAVLGASEAYKSWKEMYENRKELKEFGEQCEMRRKKRKSRSTNSGNEGGGQPQYIMPPPVILPPAGTNPYPQDGMTASPSAYYANDPAVAAGYPPGLTYAQQQAMYDAQQEQLRQQQQQQQTYSTVDGRSVPVVYPTSVRDA